MNLRPLLPLLLLVACDGSGSSNTGPKIVVKLPDPATAGTIRGKVLFKGTPPANPKLPVGGNAECNALHSTAPLDEVVLVKDGRLQNVFVYVKGGLDGYTFDYPREAVTMSNQKCIYAPRVVGAQLHQPIKFVNDDPTDHNVHGFPKNDPFNFTLRGKGAWEVRTARAEEVMVPVKCDLHAWMKGFVGVLPHPFFKVTGEDGQFELAGLPPGEIELEAWHEKYGVKSRKVKLDPKGTADVEFEFSPN